MKVLIVSRDPELSEKLLRNLSPSAEVELSAVPCGGQWDVVYVTEIGMIEKVKEVCPHAPILLVRKGQPSPAELREAWKRGALGVTDVENANGKNNHKFSEAILLEVYRTITNLETRILLLEDKINDVVLRCEFFSRDIERLQRDIKKNGKGVILNALGYLWTLLKGVLTQGKA